MSKSDKKNEGIMGIQWAIPTVILLVFLIVTLISYNATMEKKAETKALDRVSRQAMYVSGYYGGVYKGLCDSAQSLADSIIGQDDFFDEDHVIEISTIAQNYGLTGVYIVTPEGRAITSNGEEIDFFKDYSSIKSIVEAKFTTSFYRENGSSNLIISAPICTEKEWWGNVIYEYTPNRMRELIESTTYTYAFVYSNGLVAETLGNDNGIYNVGDNLNDVLSNYSFIDGTREGFLANIESGRSTFISLVNKKGYKEFVVAQPLGKIGACVLVSVYENQIQKSVKEENKETTNMVIKILFSVAVFIILVLIIYIINRVRFANENKELQNKAETDLLTDLLNKVSTEKKIQEYLEGEGKDKTSMMCVLDIDNFKKINDTMGHAFGDEVVATLGKRIRSEFRVSDIVGRIGGDEFVIFLKDLKSDEIIEKEANRISMFFKDFQVGTYTKYSPTASIGAAIYPRDASDYVSLYKSADTALYKAKKRGKKQLAFYKDASDDDKKEMEEQKNIEKNNND